MWSCLVLVAVWSIALLPTTDAFNVDTESAVVYDGAKKSLFGFSVAAHRDHDTGW